MMLMLAPAVRTGRRSTGSAPGREKRKGLLDADPSVEWGAASVLIAWCRAQSVSGRGGYGTCRAPR